MPSNSYRVMERRGFALHIVVMILFIVTLCVSGISNGANANDLRSVFAKNVWHYRMTIKVNTPEGTKTGFSVREVTYQKGLHVLPEMLPSIKLYGEAVTIDLGKRGVLFALMRGGPHGIDYGSRILFDLFPKAEKKGKIVLLNKQYPFFVTFKDLNNPLSIRAVSKYPDKSMPDGSIGQAESMEKVFGKGVSIQEISVEIVDAPVTEVISDWLPWLTKLQGGYITGKRISSGGFIGQLAGNDFLRD